MKQKRRKAFSMVEVLLVIGIMLIIGTVAIMTLTNRKANLDLTTTSQKMVSLLREAQGRSAASNQNMIYGVHFDNPSSGTPFYAIYTNTYSAANTIARYPLGMNVAYVSSTVPVGSSTDITFAGVSGLPAISTSTAISIQLPNGQVSTIVLNPLGLISTLSSLVASAGSSIAGTASTWGTTSPLPTPNPVWQHSSALYNGYIYVTGGWDWVGNVTATVWFTQISPTGSASTWQRTTSMPHQEKTHSAVATTGYIYVMGGDDGTNQTSSVVYAKLNTTGSISNWSSTTPLPAAFYEEQSAVAYNGYIYVTGGADPSKTTIATSTILFTKPNSDGSISNWSSTTPLPNGVMWHTAVAYNGYLYTTGGTANKTSTAAVTSTIFYAPINTTGSVGNWSTATPLPNPLNHHSAVAYNSYLYVAGGDDATGAITSTVRYALINANGSLGAWGTTVPLPTTLDYYSAVVNNGYIYTTAGEVPTGLGVTSTVFFTKLN